MLSAWFLEELASLGLMIVAQWLTHRQNGNLLFYTILGLTIEIKTPARHSKYNVTQIGMSLKMQSHKKWNVTQNRMSLKIEFYSKWNVNQSGMWLKMECHSKWNVAQSGM